MITKVTPLGSRQRNNFYELRDGDLSGVYDFVILDGPNGNGRSLAYLLLKDHLISGSYVLIDDITHYDFIERFLSVFSAKEVIVDPSDENNFAIFRVI